MILSIAGNYVLKTFQLFFWLIGVGIFILLIIDEQHGLLIFWNVLIPVAPLLLALFTGLWRNICPLATTSLLPDRFGYSRSIKLSNAKREQLNVIGIIILLLIIPVRHLVFNFNGWATAALLALIAITSIAVGYYYERKSGWCSGLCPIHPIEKLYGIQPAATFQNINCSSCVKCTSPCPDSSLSNGVIVNRIKKISSTIFLAGFFPGFVWGWFISEGYLTQSLSRNIITVYAIPFFSGAITYFSLQLLLKFFKTNNEWPIRFFAAAALSCYYWFRLPELTGFKISNKGMLVDLTSILPYSSMIILQLLVTLSFFWWIVIRKDSKAKWMYRPVFQKTTQG